jgi:hypothetical protein
VPRFFPRFFPRFSPPPVGNVITVSWTLRFGCRRQAGSSNRAILTVPSYPGLLERGLEARASAQRPAPKNQPATEPGPSQRGSHGQPVSEMRRGAMRCHAGSCSRSRSRVVLETTNIGGVSEKCSFGYSAVPCRAAFEASQPELPTANCQAICRSCRDNQGFDQAQAKHKHKHKHKQANAIVAVQYSAVAAVH